MMYPMMDMTAKDRVKLVVNRYQIKGRQNNEEQEYYHYCLTYMPVSRVDGCEPNLLREKVGGCFRFQLCLHLLHDGSGPLLPVVEVGDSMVPKQGQQLVVEGLRWFGVGCRVGRVFGALLFRCSVVDLKKMDRYHHLNPQMMCDSKIKYLFT